MIVGERIQLLLEERGISQSELARRVNLRQSTINALIHGHSQGSKHLHKIARVLTTTTAYLSGETDDPEGEIPEVELTSEEARLISIFRQLQVEDRKALSRVAESMLGPRTIHSPRLAYRSEQRGRR